MIERLFINFRNFLWNYPEYIYKVYSKYSPLSFIITFIIVLPLIIFYLFSIHFFSLNAIKSSVYTSGIINSNITYNPYEEQNKTLRNDINELVFNTLVKITPQDKVIGEIAKSWYKKNSTTYVFNLKKNIYFQNGINVNAGDVIYSFNFEKTNFPSPILSNITIRKLNKYSLEFNLTRVDVTFFEDINFIIVPLGSNYLTASTHIIGTGPYRLDYLTKKEAVFKRFHGYYQGDPHFNTFILKIYKNSKSLIKALEYHEINGAFFNYYPKSLNNIPDKNLFQSYSFYNIRDYVALFFNLKNVSQKNIRYAFEFDTPRKELVKKELFSFGNTIYTPISKYSWAYDKSSSIQNFHYNPTVAAKYINANEISLNVYTINSIPKRILTFLKSKWSNIGINVKFIIKSEDAINSIIKNGKYQAILTEIRGSVDPNNFSLWYSKSINNISNLNVSQIDRLLVVGDTINNIKSRKTIYNL